MAVRNPFRSDAERGERHDDALALHPSVLHEVSPWKTIIVAGNMEAPGRFALWAGATSTPLAVFSSSSSKGKD